MQKNNLRYFMEITWLVVGLVFLGFTIHAVATQGMGQSATMVALSVVPFIMYFIRRNSRKN